MFMSDFPWMKQNKRLKSQYMTYPISQVLLLEEETDISGIPAYAVVVAKSLHWIKDEEAMELFCSRLTGQRALALLLESACAEELSWLPQWMEGADEQELILRVLPEPETYETVTEWARNYEINLLSDPAYVHFHQQLMRVTQKPYTLMELMELLAYHVPFSVDLTLGRNFRPITRLNSLGLLDWTGLLKERQYEIFSADGFHVIPYGKSAVNTLCIRCIRNGPGVLILHSHRNRTVSSRDFALVRSIVPYLALAIAQQNDELDLHNATKEGLLMALLQGMYQEPLQIRLMAVSANLEYKKPRYVLIVDYRGQEPEAFGDAFDRQFAQSGMYVLATKSGRQKICILEDGQQTASIGRVKAYAETMDRTLEEMFQPGACRIALSHVCHTLSDILEAYVDAKFALVVGSALEKEKTVFWYNNYMDYHLICSLWCDELMERIYCNVIEELEEYDQVHGHCLLETLEMLVKYNFNINDAAQVMATHRNTIYRRIERINEIVGEFLNNSDKKIMLQIAVKMRTVFMIYDKLQNKDFNWGIDLPAQRA